MNDFIKKLESLSTHPRNLGFWEQGKMYARFAHLVQKTDVSEKLSQIIKEKYDSKFKVDEHLIKDKILLKNEQIE